MTDYPDISGWVLDGPVDVELASEPYIQPNGDVFTNINMPDGRRIAMTFASDGTTEGHNPYRLKLFPPPPPVTYGWLALAGPNKELYWRAFEGVDRHKQNYRYERPEPGQKEIVLTLWGEAMSEHVVDAGTEFKHLGLKFRVVQTHLAVDTPHGTYSKILCVDGGDYYHAFSGSTLARILDNQEPPNDNP